MVSQEMEEFQWIVILGAIAAFMAAFGIGANDVANAFATSVGSKALTVKQACALAVIFEFLGSVALGGAVVKTIRKGIADVDYFEEDPGLLMWGCLCVITSVAGWLLLATKLEMPVSTTHSCVGGMIGMACAARGANAVFWSKPSPDFPFVKGFAGVVISWFLSPVASGILASGFFWFVRTFILRSKNAFERAVFIYPFLVFACVTIITMFMLMKGVKASWFKDVKKMDVGSKAGIALAVGAAVGILCIPLYIQCKKRIVDGTFTPPPLAIEVADGNTSTASEEGKAGSKEAIEVQPATTWGKFVKEVGRSLNTDPHASVGVDARATAVHRNAEKFDKNAEAFFTYLQIFSAIFDAFAHGANDVANAVGPFATIYVVYHSGEVSSKADMGDDGVWILALGGIGIGVGLLLYGYQILRAIGVKLAVITPSRGFCIEMGSSLVVIIGAHLGWPLSTTHCQVGATTGVALLDGTGGVNMWVIAKCAIGWVITCFFVGVTAGVLFSIGAYAPMAKHPPTTWANVGTCTDLLNTTSTFSL